jgi:hypothetical protein
LPTCEKTRVGRMSDMGGGGIGAGNMQEAGRKMQAHVDEAEARRRDPSRGPHHEPPQSNRSSQRLLMCFVVAIVVAGAIFLFTRPESMSPLEVCRANGDHYVGENRCCKPGSPLVDRDCYQAVE